LEDRFLVQQTLEGSRSAFRILVLRHQRTLFRFLGTLIFDQALQEEIAQEAFLRAFKSLATFDPERGTSFSTWLLTIAKNLAFNELEKRRVRKDFLESEKTESEPTTESSEKLLEAAQTRVIVRKAIQELPVEFRSTVALSYLEEHSIAEIATIHGCSEGTVKSRIHRVNENRDIPTLNWAFGSR